VLTSFFEPLIGGDAPIDSNSYCASPSTLSQQ